MLPPLDDQNATCGHSHQGQRGDTGHNAPINRQVSPSG
jgi:hypothetical protein